MRLTAQGLWTVKKGNSAQEYEDGFAISTEHGCFAVADGATESDFAKEWAQLLVTGFVANPGCLRGTGRGKCRKDRILEWLTPLQNAWQEGIDWKALPWHSKEKTRRGAFATFLGLELDSTLTIGGPRWRAIAIGDSVLFQVQNNQLKMAFPFSQANEFNNTPELLCSNPYQNHVVWENVRIRRGNWCSGDIFLLCTDALAQWFLTWWERDTKPWSVLSRIEDKGEFEELATRIRSEGLVRNDDMTVVIVVVG